MTADAAATEFDWMKGRRAWLFSLGLDLLSGVRAGLERRGFDLACSTDPHGRVETLEAAERLAVALEQRSPAPDLVVISLVPPSAAGLGPLADLDARTWTAQACDPIRGLMHLLIALGARMKGRPGSIVVVGPSLSLVGCRDLVALSTLLEGQRGLIKSVARQWGSSGVTLNWIAAAPRALSAAFDAAPLAAKPDMVSVALGRAARPDDEIAPLMAFLASSAGRGMTGATLTADGGEWMTP